MTDQPTPTPRTDAAQIERDEYEEATQECDRIALPERPKDAWELCRELELELMWQRDYWESVPSGVDYEADEEDECPDDTVAHMAGIAIRRIDKLLKP